MDLFKKKRIKKNNRARSSVRKREERHLSLSLSLSKSARASRRKEHYPTRRKGARRRSHRRVSLSSVFANESFARIVFILRKRNVSFFHSQEIKLSSCPLVAKRQKLKDTDGERRKDKRNPDEEEKREDVVDD